MYSPKGVSVRLTYFETTSPSEFHNIEAFSGPLAPFKTAPTITGAPVDFAKFEIFSPILEFTNGSISTEFSGQTMKSGTSLTSSNATLDCLR